MIFADGIALHRAARRGFESIIMTQFAGTLACGIAAAALLAGSGLGQSRPDREEMIPGGQNWTGPAAG